MHNRGAGIKGFILGVISTLLLTSATVAYAANSAKIEVYFENLRYMFDGVEKKPTGTKGFIYEGTTYVPLRFVSEALGKEITWDNEAKEIWVGQKPPQAVKLTALPAIGQDEAAGALAINNWSTGGHNTAAEKIFTINGKTYSDGIGLYLHDLPYPPYIRTGGNAVYNLSGKYTRLTGLIGAGKSSVSGAAEGTLTIIGDGKELLSITGISASVSPKKVDVDLTGVQELKINFISDREGVINMILADPKLVAADPATVKAPPAKAPPAKAPSDVYIVTRNRKAEYVAIRNNSLKNTIDLKGWSVVSSDGKETYTFKNSFTLGPDCYVFLTSGNEGAKGITTDFEAYSRTLIWSAKELWKDQSEDNAQLYDASGTLVSEYK
ncbi:lamin tail domain-containing protein [Paenibacillus sp. MMS18-CY102]|uniref:lamin tail domain-containing protein n=1 Tax=Paenibacillus sp. MMS18-CY102 TaxID=2682849 RepID=UPI001365AB61|nr:lamin tail domain-containing protein [Paenibacillus sp. MMS18-CY102]MWC29163.1 hypothetical protein [Paenibacillus sp. MMS18-CY102]